MCLIYLFSNSTCFSVKFVLGFTFSGLVQYSYIIPTGINAVVTIILVLVKNDFPGNPIRNILTRSRAFRLSGQQFYSDIFPKCIIKILGIYVLKLLVHNDHKTLLNYILDYWHHVLLSSSQLEKQDVANHGSGIGLYQILGNTKNLA